MLGANPEPQTLVTLTWFLSRAAPSPAVSGKTQVAWHRVQVDVLKSLLKRQGIALSDEQVVDFLRAYSEKKVEEEPGEELAEALLG